VNRRPGHARGNCEESPITDRKVPVRARNESRYRHIRHSPRKQGRDHQGATGNNLKNDRRDSAGRNDLRHWRFRLRQIHPDQSHAVPRGRPPPAPEPGARGATRAIEGLDNFDKIIDIDQSPIGRTPRSNPATYTGLFTPIRDLFTSTPESRARGYKPGRFSFNVKGGRCEACEGDGLIRVEMHFLPDVYVPCDVCKGARYNRETLDIHYKGSNISDVLNMTIEDAADILLGDSGHQAQARHAA
jgi:hypothetical protein